MLEAPHGSFSVRTRHDLALEAAGRAPKGEAQRVGGPNYTYRIVAGRFLALLRSHGIESTELNVRWCRPNHRARFPRRARLGQFT